MFNKLHRSPRHEYGGKEGAAQMSHFAKQDGFNGFRLSVAFQFSVNNVCEAELYAENFAGYDALAQVCLATGSWCMYHRYPQLCSLE